MWRAGWQQALKAQKWLGRWYTNHSLQRSEGGIDDSAEQVLWHFERVFAMQPDVICEVGFNVGQGAATMLAASLSGKSKYIGFSLPADFSTVMLEYIHRVFGKDFAEVIWGDSVQSVPQFFKDHPDVKCDYLHIDGGHDEAVASSDIRNFQDHVSENALVVADDCSCHSDGLCDGATNAWDKAVSDGVVKTRGLVQSGTKDLPRGMCWGTYFHRDGTQRHTAAEFDAEAQDFGFSPAELTRWHKLDEAFDSRLRGSTAGQDP
eukprot:gnl/TRDRNA2_/TRDRNA2_197158_c0_seq1.p1 gnl/TRDRNA2_/TRDRNA2_197158_c0~~gnl/TRDRNA2_/TRDRNA2_197158_c0_seq1.p1  ORF type:complete len:262 (+),score=45.06 gnl/TRDRNA2_/TRDRNA2_197158_c0_seq1:74-859(+)